MRRLLGKWLLGKRAISTPRAGRRPRRQGPPVPPRTLSGAIECTASAPARGAAPAGGARPSRWAGPRPRVRAVRLGRRRHDEQRRHRGPVGLPPGPHVRHPGHQPLLGRDQRADADALRLPGRYRGAASLSPGVSGAHAAPQRRSLGMRERRGGAGRWWEGQGQEARGAILSAGTREASRGPSPLYGRSCGEGAAPALKMAAPALFPLFPKTRYRWLVCLLTHAGCRRARPGSSRPTFALLPLFFFFFPLLLEGCCAPRRGCSKRSQSSWGFVAGRWVNLSCLGAAPSKACAVN